MSELPTVFEFSKDVSAQEKPPLLPVGEYKGEIVGVEPRLSQSSGNTYAAITFRINPDQYPADFEGEADGYLMAYNRIVLSKDDDRGRYNLRKFCEAIGVPASNRIDLNEWMGAEALVEVAHEAYEGEDRASIKKVNAA